jgi:hypothetical protein
LLCYVYSVWTLPLVGQSNVSSNPLSPPPDTINFIFKAGLKKISDQVAISDSIDSKIGLLLGFVVVSVAEVFGFLLLAAADNAKPGPRYTRFTLLLFILSLGFVLAATIAGVVGLGMRKFALGYRYDALVARAKHSPDELKLIFLDDLLQSSNNNATTLNEKQRWATITLILVLCALLTQAALSVFLFVGLMPEGACHVR